MTAFDDYADRYDQVAFHRTDTGVLTMRLHTGDGPTVWSLATYNDVLPALRDVAADPDNEVVILTGTGDAFVAGADTSGAGTGPVLPSGFDPFYFAGSRLGSALLDIEAPIIAALNGPHRIHTELSLLADIVLAAENASWHDAGHLPAGIVPGDGAQVVWQELLGPVRANYFFWTQQTITAEEAKVLGLCNEVLPVDQLLARAHTLADQLLALPRLTRRYTHALLAARWRSLLRESTVYGMALEGLSLVDATARP